MQLPDPFITPTLAAVVTDPFLIGAIPVTFQVMGTIPTGKVIAFEIEDDEQDAIACGHHNRDC